MPFADDEADRLDAYLDAQAQDRLAKPDGVDPELAATYEQVMALNARSTPDPALQARLWRTMMTAFQPALPLGARSLGGPTEQSHAWLPTINRWRRPHRALNALATAALIAAMLFGAYFFNRPSNGPNFPAAQIVAPGTPAPMLASTPSPCATAVERPAPAQTIAGALFDSHLAADPSQTVTRWQLQGWRVTAGETMTFTEPIPANATDFVLSGFYSATFGSAATVIHRGEGGGGSPAIVPPGSLVELSFGDSVTFDPSKSVTITSASSTLDTVFKRALFTAEPPPSNSVPLRGGRMTIDAGGDLPQSLILPNGSSPNDLEFVFVPYMGQLPCQVGIQLGKPAGSLTSGPTAGYLLELGFGG